MVIIYKKEVNTPAGVKEKCIFLLADSLTENGSVCTTENILCSPALLDALRVKGLDAKVAVLPGSEIPVVVIGESTPVDAYVDYTSCYQLIELQCKNNGSANLPTDTLSKIKSIFQNKVGMSNELASFFISAALLQYSLQSTSLSQFHGVLQLGGSDIDYDFREITLSALSSLNASSTSMFRTVDASENYTRYQTHCTDTLFIELPERLNLLDEDTKMLSLIPKMTEVCEPYIDKVAYTPLYKSGAGVPKYLYPFIEGERKNNVTDIYENEKLFHTALTEWIEHNMIEAYGSIDSGVIDSLSQSFLQELIDHVYTWHWGHNQNVPTEILDIEAEDPERVDSRYVFTEIPGFSNSRANAIIALNDFLSEASAAVGYKVYADALVQICRWGDRKGTSIQFDGYDYSFNLGTNSKHANVGNVTDYTKVQVNGCDSSVCALIVDDTEIADSDFVGCSKWKIPVGIMTVSEMQDLQGSKISIYTYYAMVDFVQEIVQRGLKVDGVSWDVQKETFSCEELTETFTVEELVSNYVSHRDEELQDPFFRSRSLKDLYLELKAGNIAMPENLLGLMSARLKVPNLEEILKDNSFSTKEQLAALLRTRKVSSVAGAINYNVVRTILPVYKKAQELYTENTTAGLLSAWYQAMQATGYTDVSAFYREGEDAPQTQSEMSAEEAKQLQAFGKTNVKKQGAETDITVKNDASSNNGMSFLRSVHGDKYFAIKDRDTVIGHCAIDTVPMRRSDGKVVDFPLYTIVDSKSVMEESGTIPLITVMAYVVHSAYTLETNNVKAQQLFFDSLETMKKFRNVLSEYGRNGHVTSQ